MKFSYFWTRCVKLFLVCKLSYSEELELCRQYRSFNFHLFLLPYLKCVSQSLIAPRSSNVHLNMFQAGGSRINDISRPSGCGCSMRVQLQDFDENLCGAAGDGVCVSLCGLLLLLTSCTIPEKPTRQYVDRSCASGFPTGDTMDAVRGEYVLVHHHTHDCGLWRPSPS